MKQTKSIYNFTWKDNKEYYISIPILSFAIANICNCGFVFKTFLNIVLVLFITKFVGIPIYNFYKENKKWK